MHFVLKLAGAAIAGLVVAAGAQAQTGQVPPADANGAKRAAPAAMPGEPAFGTRVTGHVAGLAAGMGARTTDREDVAALQAYYAANPDRPLWLESGKLSIRAQAAIAEIGRADDWGLTAGAFALPALEAGNDAPAQAEAEARLSLAVLKYARHARGGRMDPTRLGEAFDRTANLLSPAKVLEDVAKASAVDDYLRRLHPQHPQFEKLRRLYLALRSGRVEQTPPAPVAEQQPEPGKGRRRKAAQEKKAPAPTPLTAERVLVNMEQWRWMPADLGALHVMVNIPEFALKVVKQGSVIHTERVVTGQAANPTPIFTKDMQSVVFQPGWGVPPGIKVKELLPGLLAGRDTISGRGLVVRRGGRDVSPSSIDWHSTDIRRVDIVQPPGPRNALGVVKFLFPNKHDVYMHDTPSKHLFNAEVRAFSHGCVRVRNPVKLAEVVFAETAGWGAGRVASLVKGGKPENQVMVSGQIGVHLTYFTVVVDDDGKPQTFRDIYGHEPKVRLGMDGRIDQVARKTENLAAVRSRLVSQASARSAGRNSDQRSARHDARHGGSGGIFGGLFGF